MNFKHFAFLLLAGVLFTSCKTNSETTTPGGFKYEVLNEGTGESIKDDDYVYFTIKVLGDDTELINEMNDENDLPVLRIPEELPTGPQSNPIIDVFKLSHAKVGAEYKLYMPLDSLPGARAEYPHIENFVYYFTIKKIVDEEAFNQKQQEAQAEMAAKAALQQARLPEIEALVKSTLDAYKAGKLKTEKTPSGLEYYIVEQGTGDNTQSGQVINADYYGTLMDGTKFDDSFSRGQEFSFVVGQGMVIRGWDEGFTHFNKGSKGFLFIPYELAYGEAGSPPVIPAQANLLFYVELNDIQNR
ncbi:MAG: FKBP-type peptidyl-prolyl cis-trans isomerase [Chitinophagales bacterium]|nr:FKBP-type peptidyl-prolyl cis-trans isomerase [Chitinophagales bacterium]